MNDPLFLARKFEELINAAEKAETEFERAAVYAACEVITGKFVSDDGFNEFTRKKAVELRDLPCPAGFGSIP